MKTRSNENMSLQVAKGGDFTDLETKNFTLESGSVFFNIKNEGEEAVSLSVRLSGNDEFQTWKFYPGWNPEIVKEVEQTNSDVSNLKWGY